MCDTSEQVCEVQLKPKERSRFLLGEFDADKSFKGLSIEISPDPDPEDSVVTRIIQLDSTSGPNTHTLMMHIANHGSKTVKAVVHQLS